MSREIKEDSDIKTCFWMAFCPSGAEKIAGIKPYASPHSHPSGARQQAVLKHFGVRPPQISDHQVRAMWDFLYEKGFRIKRCVSVKIDKVLAAEAREFENLPE